MSTSGTGYFMYSLINELFPLCRSLTGNGARQSLAVFRREIKSLALHEVPSGTRCFDWTIPEEWNVSDAWVIAPDGEKIIDFKRNNLHLLGYSLPFDGEVSLEELDGHLYSRNSSPT